MGERWALVIGNTEYEDPLLERSKLRAPANDIADLARVLDAPAIGDFRVTSLLDAEDGRIRQEIGALFSDKRGSDVLLVYYSGHGLRTEKHKNLYLAARNTEVLRFTATGISAQWIVEQLEESEARRKIVILDCCYSGAARSGARDLLGESAGAGELFMGDGSGRVIMTASRNYELAWERDKVYGKSRKSLFTHFLVRGLTTNEADIDGRGSVTHDELYTYVYDKVKAASSRKRGQVQTPQMSGQFEGQIHIANVPSRAVTKHASASVTRGANPHLSIGLSLDSQTLRPAPESTWTVTALNDGDDDLADVRIWSEAFPGIAPFDLKVERRKTIKLPPISDWELVVEATAKSSDERHVEARAEASAVRVAPARIGVPEEIELHNLVDWVNAIEERVETLTNEELRAKTDEFRSRLAADETMNEIEVEAYAVVREASKRVLDMRHRDAQVYAAGVFHRGGIAQMQAGEGKTLAVTMPAYLNALTGKGVHVVVLSHELAQRDADELGAVHRFLGLDIGVLRDSEQDKRMAAYAADITFGTSNDFGFDYLRDNLATTAEAIVQRGQNFAVIDEADAILIDEARTPLSITERIRDPTKWYRDFASIVSRLQSGVHYEVDEHRKRVNPTEKGVREVERILGIADLYGSPVSHLVHHLDTALQAKALYKRDVDYVVHHGEIELIDRQTGRVLENRTLLGGKQQAIEAKEGLRISNETQTVARITVQNYFRKYQKLSGTSATAQPVAEELGRIYGTEVVVVPPHFQRVRTDHPDEVYGDERHKFAAIVDDIEYRHQLGQPVLVGTTSIERSEKLSALLGARGIPHQVLTAKHHNREAEIIAQAGRVGRVTVATTIAGRGVEIDLGGNPREEARAALRRRGLDQGSEGYEDALISEIESMEREASHERKRILDLGGLYVIGSERHESRRLDNQLRQHAGRCGEPGESRFYLSFDDYVMRMFTGDLMTRIVRRLRIPPDQPLDSKMVNNAIARAQRQMEERRSNERTVAYEYDQVLDRQRDQVYEWRNIALRGDARKLIEEWLDGTLRATVVDVLGDAKPEQWIWGDLLAEVGSFYDSRLGWDLAQRESVRLEDVAGRVAEEGAVAYRRREREIGSGLMRRVERAISLSVIDNQWRQHLTDLDDLYATAAIAGLSARGTLVEYHERASELFIRLEENIRRSTIRYLFRVQPNESKQSAEIQETDSAPLSSDQW